MVVFKLKSDLVKHFRTQLEKNEKQRVKALLKLWFSTTLSVYERKNENFCFTDEHVVMLNEITDKIISLEDLLEEDRAFLLNVIPEYAEKIVDMAVLEGFISCADAEYSF